MKKTILTSLIAFITTVGAYAQLGTITFDNGNANPNATLSSTIFGLIYTTCTPPLNGAGPLNQDINLALLGGPNANSLSLIASLTFANGLAQGDNTAFGTPGQFADLSGSVYTIPGVAAGQTAFLEVEAWIGNFATYQEAALFGDIGNSGVFQSLTGGSGIPPSPPISIGDGMPSFLVGPLQCPEPSTLALCSLGVASLLLFRRKK